MREGAVAMPAVIFDTKEALFEGQKILAGLGYAEIGAKNELSNKRI